MTARAQWLGRLAAALERLQPGLAPLELNEADRLGDMGVDSLVFEELFAWLAQELPAPLPAIAWFNQLEAADGRVGVLLDLIEAHERAHA